MTVQFIVYCEEKNDGCVEALAVFVLTTYEVG